MTGLIIFREQVKKFYTTADIYILPALKFVIALIVFTQINSRFGYFELFGNVFVLLVLSIVCALLPFNGTVIIGMVLLVVDCFALGIEVGVVALGLYLLLLILVLRFVSSESFAVLIAPFAFAFNFAAAIPVSLGLTKRAASVLTGVCAVISAYFLKMLPAVEKLKSADLNGLELLKKMLSDLFQNKEMLMTIIIFVAVTLVVHMLHTLLSQYGWSISIIAGCVTYLLLSIVGSAVTGARLDVAGLIITVLVSAGICFMISFFLFSVDYKGSRRLQFEDDEYYYYVKAIPKNSLIKAEKMPERHDDEF